MLSRGSTWCCSTSRPTTWTDGLDRLERFVADLRSGVVLVSHDREFLARARDSRPRT